MNNDPSFLYLNRQSRWPGFAWHDLDLDADGGLQLASLPLLQPAMRFAGQGQGAAGVAVDSEGTLYWSHGGRIMFHACDGTTRPLSCTGGDDDVDAGNGDAPRQIRALLFHPGRPALMVADSANHRLELFSLSDFQLIDVWGGAGNRPGELLEPWSLAADRHGDVYVVDKGNHRVQKFDLRGDVIEEFWDRASSEADFVAPHLVSVHHLSIDRVTGHTETENNVYVLDSGAGKIFVLSTKGFLRAALTLPEVSNPSGLLVHGDAIYIGDGDRRRLLKLRLDGTLVGEALGYEGPVAGLAIDGDSGLWLHPGSGEPLGFSTHGGHVRAGVLWGGPVSFARARAWHRLRALGEPLSDGAHFRFFLRASDNATPPPAPTAGQFDLTSWSAMAPDAADVLVGAETKNLWIGALLAGDGRQSPRIEQMRLEFDHTGYSEHLPATFREPGKGGDAELLDRFLSLFESFFVDAEATIGDLPRLFDPAATDTDWLSWLAAWLALDLNADRPIEWQRRAIAEAFTSYAWRGTARGLRAALLFHAGVEAHVEEPHAQTAWWALAPPDSHGTAPASASVLGESTVLVPAQAQGAVLGTTAVLGESDLIRDQDFGAPLFTETAHRFSVEVHQSQAAGKLDQIRDIVEREKPAHTAYQICLIEPRFRVGWQARLGIDTVAGGTPTATRVDAEPGGFVLGGQGVSRLGDGTRVGMTTRVSTSRVPATRVSKKRTPTKLESITNPSGRSPLGHGK